MYQTHVQNLSFVVFQFITNSFTLYDEQTILMKEGKGSKKCIYTDQACNHEERQTYIFFHKTMFNSKYLPIEKSNNTPKEKIFSSKWCCSRCCSRFTGQKYFCKYEM